jgi:Protein of unknown function DUF72
LTILIPWATSGGREFSQKLDTFLSTMSLGQTRLALEFRGGEPTEDTLKVLRDHGVVHSVDISNRDPKLGSNLLYSRLFGRGKENVYEFDDGELRDIAAKAGAPEFEKSILAFHGVRMYRDAARLKTFLNTGKFPSITGQVGLESIGEVLREDAMFPTSKAELMDRQGWKLYDKTSDERRRIGVVLKKLPDRTYATRDEVLLSLRATDL